MKLSHKLKKSPGFIFNYLSDMQKFVSVHPVIYQIDDKGNDTYLVHERLKFGFIPFRFTYPVKVEIISQNEEICIKATVFKLTKIQMHFKLKKEGEFTLVEEQIEIKSPLPVKMIMEGIFRKQHEKLFEGIGLER